MSKVTSKKGLKSKSTASVAKKTAPKISKAKVSAEELIEKACTDALQKLQSLKLDQQFQSEIEWCLGSYRYDRNPHGLYQMAERALSVFKTEAAKKTKGITATFIKSIEKALQARS